MPETIPVAKPTVVTLSTSDLFVPDWNPRKLVKEGPLQDLIAYLKSGGIVPKLWVWKGAGTAQAGSSQEPAHPNQGLRLVASAQGPFAVISGQRRLLAYKRLGITELEVDMYDVPLEQAKDMAISSNQDDEMHWWERCKSIAERAKAYSGSQRSLAPTLGVDPATVNRSIRIFGALTPGAVAMLDAQCITDGTQYDPSLRVVLALTDLKDPQTVEKALKVAIERKMAEGEAKKLVKWVKDGNPVESYATAPKAPSPKKESGNQTAKPKAAALPADEALDKLIELAGKAALEIDRNDSQTTYRDQLKAYLETLKVRSSELESSPSSASPQKPSGISSPKGTQQSLFLELLAGISIFKQIDTKIKKNGKVTFFEVVLLALHDMGRGVAFLSKHSFKVIGHILKFIKKLLKVVLKVIGELLGKPVTNFIQGVVLVILICGFAWGCWDGYRHGPLHPFEVVWSKTAWGKKSGKPVESEPAKTPEASSSTETKEIPVNHPVINTQAAAPKVVAPVPNANGNNWPSAQPNHVAQLEASNPDTTSVSGQSTRAPQLVTSAQTQAPQPTPIASTSNSGSISTTTSAIATIQPTPTAHTDVAGQIIKQTAPDVAGDLAKKLFNF